MAKLLGYQVATNTTIYRNHMAKFGRCSTFAPIWEWTSTPSHPLEYDAATKDMIKRLNLQPENFFLTPRMTIEKFKRSRNGWASTPLLRHPDLLRVPCRQTRSELLRLGHSDAQYPRLESPVIS